MKRISSYITNPKQKKSFRLQKFMCISNREIEELKCLMFDEEKETNFPDIRYFNNGKEYYLDDVPTGRKYVSDISIVTQDDEPTEFRTGLFQAKFADMSPKENREMRQN